MTSRPAIAVEHLSKAFKIYRDPRDMLWELLSSRPRHSETWALRGVSFKVDPGEVVGVIGRNGAGKSTLLKIIAGTMEPTEGTLTANGSIAAILELGTGFNPEYSGREGIVMGGLCMGMSRQTIDERLDEIIAFSELEDAIEHPLRTYSTGMRMRLAFSTAIATDAQTLIIDEALAVGDALFQAKCMDRLEEIKRSGRTVFFVSHNIGSIYQLCSRALLIDEGRLLLDDTPRKVGYAYEALLNERKAAQVTGAPYVNVLVTDQGEATSADGPDAIAHSVEAGAIASDAAGEQLARQSPAGPEFAAGAQPPLLSHDVDAFRRRDMPIYVESIAVYDHRGEIVTALEYGADYQVRVRGRLLRDMPAAVLGYFLELESGMVLFGTSTFNAGIRLGGSAGDSVEARFVFRSNLNWGSYFVGGAAAEVVNGESLLVHTCRRAVRVTVVGAVPFEGPVNATVAVTRSEAKALSNAL